MASLSAMERVLAVDELLELTLSFLDPRTLLLAQRVSKRYKNLIGTSPSLQKALFFRPRDEKEKPVFVDDRTQRPYKYVRQNELLCWAFPAFFNGPEIDKSDFRFPITTTRSNLDSFHDFPWTRRQESKAAFRQKEASWRKMLLCDLPINHSAFKLAQSGTASRCEEASLYCGDGGLRMGEIYDPVQYHVVECGASRNPEVSFQVQWPIPRNQNDDQDESDLGRRMYVGEEGYELAVDVNVQYFYHCLSGFVEDGIRGAFRSEAAPEKVELDFKRCEKPLFRKGYLLDYDED